MLDLLHIAAILLVYPFWLALGLALMCKLNPGDINNDR